MTSAGVRIRCASCDGHGLMDTMGGPEECGECEGGGWFWLYLRSGRIARWPGGPFVGRMSPREMAVSSSEDGVPEHDSAGSTLASAISGSHTTPSELSPKDLQDNSTRGE